LRRLSCFILTTLIFWGAIFCPLSANNRDEVLNLANALYLWANSHQGLYPEPGQLHTRDFLDLLAKAGGDPQTLKAITYRPARDRKNFSLNWGRIAFSSQNGLAQRSEISPEDREQMIKVIKALYQAYVGRNLERIMTLQHEAVEASAEAYEKSGKGTREDVRDAFRECTREIIDSPEFQMVSLCLEDLRFSRQGELYLVKSPVPILLSTRVMVQASEEKQPVTLRIEEIHFIKTPQGFKIQQMNLIGN